MSEDLTAGMDLNAVRAISMLDRGLSLRTVAPQFGLSFAGLRKWLLREVPEAYREAQTDGLLHRVAEADDALETAEDAVHIARAREVAKFARMDLERRRPQLYGAKQEAGNALTVNILTGGDVVVAPQVGAVQDPESVIMSNPNRALGVAAAQRAKHIARLASLSPEQLAALISLADQVAPQSIGPTPDRSPVAPPLVDSGGHKSVSLGVGTPDGTVLNSGTR